MELIYFNINYQLWTLAATFLSILVSIVIGFIFCWIPYSDGRWQVRLNNKVDRLKILKSLNENNIRQRYKSSLRYFTQTAEMYVGNNFSTALKSCLLMALVYPIFLQIVSTSIITECSQEMGLKLSHDPCTPDSFYLPLLRCIIFLIISISLTHWIKKKQRKPTGGQRKNTNQQSWFLNTAFSSNFSCAFLLISGLILIPEQFALVIPVIIGSLLVIQNMHRRKFGAFLTVYFFYGLVACIGFILLYGVESAVLSIVFYIILPMINAIMDAVSWRVTQKLIRKIEKDSTPISKILIYLVLDITMGLMLLFALVIVLPFIIETFNYMGDNFNQQKINWHEVVAGAEHAPFTLGLLATGMLLTTLLPTLLHVFVGIWGILISPFRGRERIIKILKSWDDKTTTGFQKQLVVDHFIKGQSFWFWPSLLLSMTLSIFMLVGTVLVLPDSTGSSLIKIAHWSGAIVNEYLY